MSNVFYPSDSNLTSISQRIPNNSSKTIIMPNLPKINLCQTNWQQEDANILSSKIASASVPNDLLNDDADKENDSYKLMPPPAVNEIEFFSWTPYLNRNLQIAVKGETKDGFERGRSIQKRLSNTKLIDKGQTKQKLRGTITINKDLPMYIAEKFKNGFPKDWEIVTATWADYVRQYKPNDFRWPSPVSDLNEDINDNHSEYLDKSCGSTLLSENSIIVQSELPRQIMNDTYNLVESSVNQVKILSNVLLNKSNLEKQSENIENIVSQIKNQQNDCLSGTANDLNENSHFKNITNDSVTNVRKRNHSIENDSTSETNKRRKLSEVMDNLVITLTKLNDQVMDNLITTLTKLNDNIKDISFEIETMKTKADCKSPQIETCGGNTKEVPEIKTPPTPASPEIMGISNRKFALVNSTRSAYLRKRRIRKKRQSSLHQNMQITNYETVVESKSSFENQSVETSMNDTITNFDIEKIPQKRTFKSSSEKKKYTKIATNKMADEERPRKNYCEIIDSQKDIEDDTRNSFEWECRTNFKSRNEALFENNSHVEHQNFRTSINNTRTDIDFEKIQQKRATGRSSPLTERRNFTKISRISKSKQSDSGIIVSDTITSNNVVAENNALIRSSGQDDKSLFPDSRKNYYETIDFQKDNDDVSNSFVSKGTYTVHQSTPKKFHRTLKPNNETVFEIKSPSENQIVETCNNNTIKKFNFEKFFQKRAPEGTPTIEKNKYTNISTNKMDNEDSLRNNNQCETINSQKENEDDTRNSFVWDVHQSNLKKIQTPFENNSPVDNQNFEMSINNTITEFDIEKILKKRASRKSSSLTERRKCTIIPKISKSLQSNSGIIVPKTVTPDNIAVDNNSSNSSSAEDDRLFSDSFISHRKTICENLEKPKVVIEKINPSPPLQYSLRGRVRCEPLKYWEGETLDKLVTNTNKDKKSNEAEDNADVKQNKKGRKKSVAKNMSDNIIHPALHPENTTFLRHAKNGRVKLFDRTVEKQIDTLIDEQNVSNHTHFTEF